MQDKMKVAVIQMCSACEVRENHEQAAKFISRAVEQGAEFIALPESFNSMARSKNRYDFADQAQNGSSRKFLAKMARRHAIYLSAGVVTQSGLDDKIHNCCLLFAPDGRQLAAYYKNHLFDINLDEKERHAESSYCLPGDQPVTVDCGFGAVGLSVCYDLRFPEYYRLLSDAGVIMMLVPSAFTHPTGLAHWEVLLRARAIENQVFILAPAQWGQHENGRHTYGDSMIVDPWGEIIARKKENTGPAVAELDFSRLRSIRKKLPALKHRRYRVIVPVAPAIKR
jgi:nitrilase